MLFEFRNFVLRLGYLNQIRNLYSLTKEFDSESFRAEKHIEKNNKKFQSNSVGLSYINYLFVTDR